MDQIVAETVSCQNQIISFFDNQRIALLLKQSNMAKKCGIAPVVVMRMIFSLVFNGKNLFRYLQADASGSEVGKDTVYRFLNSVNANWRKFLHLLCANVLNRKILPLTSVDTPKVFIVDDSLYDRNRSKNVELLARVYDHNDQCYYRGFRLLTLGWSDGSSYLPVSFSLLSSANEKNRLAPMAEVDKRTNGFKRRAESTRKSPDVLKRLVRHTRVASVPIICFLIAGSLFLRRSLGCLNKNSRSFACSSQRRPNAAIKGSISPSMNFTRVSASTVEGRRFWHRSRLSWGRIPRKRPSWPRSPSFSRSSSSTRMIIFP